MLRPAVVVVALGGVLLGGCSDTAGTGGGTTPPGTEVSTPPPPATTDPALPNLPTDCDTLGTAATRAQALQAMELYDEPPQLEQPAPQGATLALGCDWFAGDITGITVTISTATPDAVTAAAGTLASQGYTCTQNLGGHLCAKRPTSFEESLDMQKIVFARDGVWVSMSTTAGTAGPC